MRKVNRLTINAITLICLMAIPLIFSSCNRKNLAQNQEDGLLQKIITNTSDLKCSETMLQGIDSHVGKISCVTDTFSYDLGRYGYKGPISLLENFKTTFHHYHFSAFFRKIGMDEKVFKSLRSQVVIDSVFIKSEFNRNTLFECDPCNAVAKIDFEDTTFFYPYTDSPSIIESQKSYDFYYLEEGDYYYKWYKPQAGEGEYGLFVTFMAAEIKDQNLAITITHSKDYQQSFNWLRSLRLKENIQETITLK